MKLTLILVLVFIAAISISCVPVKNIQANTPNPSISIYTSEQVLEIAKKFSPECRVKKPIDWGAKTAG